MSEIEKRIKKRDRDRKVRMRLYSSIDDVVAGSLMYVMVLRERGTLPQIAYTSRALELAYHLNGFCHLGPFYMIAEWFYRLLIICRPRVCRVCIFFMADGLLLGGRAYRYF